MKKSLGFLESMGCNIEIRVKLLRERGIWGILFFSEATVLYLHNSVLDKCKPSSLFYF
jgi:hypothetical protein